MSLRSLLQPLVQSYLSTQYLSGQPSNVVFSRDRSAIYFVATTATQSNSTIYAAATHEQGDAKWKPVISEAFIRGELSVDKPMTKEEELLRERQRTTNFGITSFVYHEATERILFSATGSLWIVSVHNLPPEGAVPQEIVTRRPGARMDPKFSPDGQLVSFVRDGDIWCVSPEVGLEYRLTNCRRDGEGGDATLSAGVAEFIMQEEFDRYTGYWWSPVVEATAGSSPAPSALPTYRLAYLETDESGVEVYHIPSEGEGRMDSFRYPLAGQKNVRSALCMVELYVDPASASPATLRSVVKRLTPGLYERIAWVEYVVRVGWTPDGRRVWAQLLDRPQQTLELVYFALDEFLEPASTATSTATTATPPTTSATPPTTGNHVVVWHESSAVWINVTNILEVLDNGDVLWGSEAATGFRQLYLLCAPDYATVHRVTNDGDGWQVDDDVVVVDKKRKCVFFVGSKDTPLEHHLYVASLDPFDRNFGRVYRLTDGGFDHKVWVSSDGAVVVSTYSNIATPPVTAVYSTTPAEAADSTGFRPPALVLLTRLEDHLPPPPVSPLFPLAPPEMFSFRNEHGDQLFGALWVPPTMSTPQTGDTAAFPLLIRLYAGPHAQLVTNSYRLTRSNCRNLLFAHRFGIAVATVDGRGSARRGLAFEGALRERMGTVEIADQAAAVQYLVRSHPTTAGRLDPARVAVTGWSYGGYASLLCLALYPDVFKLAIAGAPVTRWEGYDTGYTERYMNTPQNNSAGYRTASVLSVANQFPDEENRLLIIHGLLDENVHFHGHTAPLLRSLAAAGKPYQLLLYPDERHGVRSIKNLVHLEVSVMAFLLNNLTSIPRRKGKEYALE